MAESSRRSGQRFAGGRLHFQRLEQTSDGVFRILCQHGQGGRGIRQARRDFRLSGRTFGKVQRTYVKGQKRSDLSGLHYRNFHSRHGAYACEGYPESKRHHQGIRSGASDLHQSGYRFQRFFGQLWSLYSSGGRGFRSDVVAVFQRGIRQTGFVEFSTRRAVSRHALLEAVFGETCRQLVHKVLKETAEDLKAGNSLSQALAKHHEMPNIIIQMIHVGEESGELGNILKMLARFYEREVSTAVDTMVGLMEPVMIISLALGVGFLLASVLMPIYNMAGAIS